MYKYRYFPILFGVCILLLIALSFPIAFDNNDDHIMYFIASGLLSNIPSDQLMLSSSVIGKILNLLFTYSHSINWYALFLQAVQLISLTCMLFLLIPKHKTTSFETASIWTILVFGIGALCVVKLQFTTVALFTSFAALFFLEKNSITKIELITVLILIVLAILIRKESFFVFIVFSIPLLIRKFKNIEQLKKISSILVFSILVYLFSSYVDSKIIPSASTYNLRVIDNMAAKPTVSPELLKSKSGKFYNEVILFKSWFIVDYSEEHAKELVQISKQINQKRSLSEFYLETKKFFTDERYILLIYFISIILILISSSKNKKFSLLNLLLVIVLFGYLLFCSRLPHRLSFPILAYLTLLNIYYTIALSTKPRLVNAVFGILLIMSLYKMYCVFQIIPKHKNYQSTFDNYHRELNAHPEKLFIALSDGFPVQYMNTYLSPQNLFPSQNIIFTGWYMASPDFQTLLHRHQLNNLTSDLSARDDVYFLSPSSEFKQAYLNYLKNKFGISASFEAAAEEFYCLKPEKLIFKN